jgi:hypothetical protein
VTVEKHLWLPTARDGMPALICPCRRVWRCDQLEPKGPCLRFERLERDARRMARLGFRPRQGGTES